MVMLMKIKDHLSPDAPGRGPTDASDHAGRRGGPRGKSWSSPGGGPKVAYQHVAVLVCDRDDPRNDHQGVSTTVISGCRIEDDRHL